MDEISKRRNLAIKAVDAATQFVDSLNTLLELRQERSNLVDVFIDSDFATAELEHVDAGMLGVLFDFVVPNLETNYTDTANGGRNKQILLQVRN